MMTAAGSMTNIIRYTESDIIGNTGDICVERKNKDEITSSNEKANLSDNIKNENRIDVATKRREILENKLNSGNVILMDKIQILKSKHKKEKLFLNIRQNPMATFRYFYFFARDGVHNILYAFIRHPIVIYVGIP